MFLLFSHKLTLAQKDSAKVVYGVEEFIYLPEDLQKIWTNVPSDMENLKDYLIPIEEYLDKFSNKDDIVLIQGDFGAVYHMVEFSKKQGLIAIYATTKRRIKEYFKGDSLVKESIFEFVRFREYE